MDAEKYSIESIKGVGPKRAKLLNKLGIQTIEDLILYIPRDYQDRSVIKKIIDTIDDESVSIIGQITTSPQEFKSKRGLRYTKVTLSDSSGKMDCIWFNMPYVKNNLTKGDFITVFGKVEKKQWIVQMINPAYKVLSSGAQSAENKITPIYSLTNGITNLDIIKAVEYCLKNIKVFIQESLDNKYINELNIIDRYCAIENIHFPKSMEMVEKARQRLAFDEFLNFQLFMLMQKSNSDSFGRGIIVKTKEELKVFIDNLPFKLTEAQLRVFKEVQGDIESSRIMNRLIQGDVGSGKTMIAVLALYQVVLNGYQGAIMVPTEILAEQHYLTFKQLLSGLPVKIELITGSQSKNKKEEIVKLASTGGIDILIGTHALIEDQVRFNNLALVVTDEQHRFGVRQRAKLSLKGTNPHVMVMTATPIPRTLAYIVYGDLDVSIIDQLPPGRKKIETYSVDNSKRERIFNFIKKNIKEGRQVYVVCPLIDESENLDLLSVYKTKEIMEQYNFDNFKIEILHGKMGQNIKDEIMKRFRDGHIDILISTTVIEVGVNVPNASIMVVENAERFGLAQLHQLRGRVGRGQYQSYCILINQGKTSESKERMKIMEKYNDGFIIAQKDMELRGTGEFFGIRQHGDADFKIANIFKDIELLTKANVTAKEIFKEDNNLQNECNNVIRQEVMKIYKKHNIDISIG